MGNKRISTNDDWRPHVHHGCNFSLDHRSRISLFKRSDSYDRIFPFNNNVTAFEAMVDSALFR